MPQDLSARLNEIRLLLKEGKHDQARSIIQRLLRQDPSHPGLNQLMCLSLAQRLDYARALYFAQRAVAAEPRSPELLINLANCLTFTDRRSEAISAYLRALQARPDHPGALDGLAHAYIDDGQTSEALDCLARLLALNPRNSRAVRTRAGLLLDMGRQQESIDALQQGLKHEPESAELATGLCSAMNYIEDADPREVFDTHVRFGQIIERCAAPAVSLLVDSWDPERRLRLGVISSDFRSHSCAWFAEPMIGRLDRDRFSTTVYFGHVQTDAVTARFKRLVDQWRDTATVGDDALAEQVRQDKIDVLVELHGHTSGQRFPTLARQPAPVQVTWLGYPNTTGLRAIRYRIVDGITDPPESSEALAVESLVRLDPCFLCYGPPVEAPEPGPPPCATPHAGGRITLGSFNALPKLSDGTIRLWSRAVRSLDARLVLKHLGMSDQRVQAQVTARFAEAGLRPDQIEYLQPTKGLSEHLKTYEGIDIALETFPYHGTTTTCEALWMGVPVVTLAGRVHASRVGVSLLTNVGLPELIARSEDEYIRIVSSLARDPGRLVLLRSTLRGRMESSPLCDAPAFARRFGDALRTMWREQCAQQHRA